MLGFMPYHQFLVVGYKINSRTPNSCIKNVTLFSNSKKSTLNSTTNLLPAAEKFKSRRLFHQLYRYIQAIYRERRNQLSEKCTKLTSLTDSFESLSL